MLNYEKDIQFLCSETPIDGSKITIKEKPQPKALKLHATKTEDADLAMIVAKMAGKDVIEVKDDKLFLEL